MNDVGGNISSTIKRNKIRIRKAMEAWKLKVAEATDEFSETKKKEGEALAILTGSEDLFDQARRAALRNNWLRLKRESQQKNHAVLRLIQSVPKEKK